MAMYIHQHYQLDESDAPISTYKQKLSTLCKINLRRANKFNLLAVYGAVSCMQNQPFSNNIGIYLATERGPVESLRNVLEQVTKEGGVVMPFDFLGINTNASFYIAQALGAQGKHMVLTSHHLSFEKALQLAYFDLMHNEVDDILVGCVDTSLSFLEEKYRPKNSPHNHDKSTWLYANREPKNAIARIESIEEFSSLEAMHKNYPNENIQSDETLLQCLTFENQKRFYVKHDEKGKCVVIKMARL